MIINGILHYKLERDSANHHIETRTCTRTPYSTSNYHNSDNNITSTLSLSFLSSEVAEIHLQQHILEQYSISKTTLLQDMDPEEEKATSTDDIASLSLEAQKITNSYSSGLSDLVVPTPTLTFPTTWSSTKSLPQSLTSSLTGKPHSCAITSPTKIRKTELTQPPPQAPLLSPTAAQQDPVTTRSPIVVYAWSPVKSGNKPKQTQVSNLRSMRER